jgi:hypothetical protein
MAGRGFPAEPGSRRYKKATEGIKLVSDGKLRGKSLPRNVLRDKDGNPVPWHPMTVKWWNSWRKSPQAMRMMTGPDWDFLLDTALMHHEMWSAKKWELAAEVRLRVTKFGATPEDRSRLRVEIGVSMPSDSPVGASPVGSVVSVEEFDARRARIVAQNP